jgi:hypothetical protein
MIGKFSLMVLRILYRFLKDGVKVILSSTFNVVHQVVQRLRL